MSPEVEAAIIAGGVGVLTVIVALYGTRKTSQDTKDGLNKQLTEQREALERRLKEQREALDKTLVEQRTRTFNERFAMAADRLGIDKSASIRLAGVYAMAGLADDWEENRQTCIDVLCGYLRMPSAPDPGAPDTRLGFLADREVRHTVVRVIAMHLRDGAKKSWQGMDFDFTGGVFDGGDFTGATFSAGQVSFTGATFSGGTIDFTGATFSGGQVYFGATFSGSTVKFAYAMFSGADVGFRDATLSSGTVDFEGATFSKNATFSGKVWFGGATFSGSTVKFAHATMSGGTVGFRGATFSGGTVDFTGTRFSRGLVDFSSVAKWTRPPKFDFDWDSPPSGVKLPAAVHGKSQ